MGRLIIVFVLLGSLVGLATMEQIWVRNVYRRLESDLATLTASMEPLEKIDTPYNIELSKNMYHRWVRDERRLVMLARHFDLMQVSDALIYIMNFVYFDNKEEASVGMRKLQYLIDTHQFNVATSVRNVI